MGPDSLIRDEARDAPAARSGLRYLTGFGNEHASEAVPGALPAGRNAPLPPRGLYAEQLSGTAFTAPRAQNRDLALPHPALGDHPPYRRIDNGLRARPRDAGADAQPAALEPAAGARRPDRFRRRARHARQRRRCQRASGVAIHSTGANRP